MLVKKDWLWGKLFAIIDWLEVSMETDESPGTPTPIPPPPAPSSPPLSPPGSPLQVLTQSLRCIGERQHEGDGQNVNDVYAELQARMETIKKEEHVLKSEIVDIKERFLALLKSCGVDDVSPFNKTITSRDPPSTNSPGMTTPHSTPRRVSGRLRTPDNMRCMYADLLIEQLLAQASSLTDSSDLSNSPPEPENSKASSGEAAQAAAAGAACASVNVNVSTPNKDCEKDKDIHSNYQVPPDYHLTPRKRIGLSATNIRVNSNTSDVLTTSSNSLPESASSDVYPASSEQSSDNQVVPDLDKELVSRMQYYSDFTIDRQRKIDEASGAGEVNDENIPPPCSDHSSEGISQRCVEGSESEHHVVFQIPQTKVCNTPLTSVSCSTRGKRSRRSSSESRASDFSSGTGSMPRSHYSSHDRLGRASTRDASSSSRERTSSSRGSRCSSHPLASSTLISDPSSNAGRGSLGSGSVYTWSIDESSDCENLEQSYFRSKGRHRRRVRRLKHRSRQCSTASRSSRSHKSGGSRPTTSIGADSPPQEQAQNASLHLTAMSVIEAGNLMNKASTMPRTSTRICLFPSNSGSNAQKSSSAPELSNPTYPDLDMAVSAIGPSNLSSQLQQTATDRSASPLHERLEPPGKSSTSASTGSSNCPECHPSQAAPSATPQLSGDTELLDSILTDSPHSFDSSGAHAPYNSYTSPAGSHTGYSTVSSWSSESNKNAQRFPAAPPPTPPTVKPQADSVFKVPHSPAWSSKRRVVSNGHAAQNSVGVRVVTPRAAPSVVPQQGGDPIMRRKLFPVAQPTATYNPPKVLDKKALVKKFKKFSTNFYRKDKIKTLANL